MGAAVTEVVGAAAAVTNYETTIMHEVLTGAGREMCCNMHCGQKWVVSVVGCR